MPRILHPAHLESTGDAGRWRGEPWPPFVAVAFALVFATLLGGGGSRYAFANLVVQLGALGLLAYRSGAVFDFWRSAPLPLRILVAITLLLPTIQLIPLPESVWSALPGRDLVAQSFELTGRSGWAPASVDPVRTLLALTALILPFAILAAGWTLPRRNLVLLCWLVVGLALANVLIGIPQVLSGGTTAVLFPEGGARGVLYGFFANRNSTGLLLVGAIGMAAMLPAPRPHPAIMPARIIICVLLVVGIVLTRSRTALVLTSVPLALIALRALWWSRSHRHLPSRPSSGTTLAVVAAIFVTLGTLATTAIIAPGRVAETVERFEATGDARAYIWEDAAYSASRYWPAGAGMGAFDEVFQVDESLENSTERRAGRAHNDFLELAIEAGLPGLIVLTLWLCLIAWLAWRARRSRLRWVAWSAAAFLLAIALQSITDYPLRNLTMLGFASFAMLILARISTRDGEAAL